METRSGANTQRNDVQNVEKLMDEYLNRKGLFRKRIAKDGSCLFRAVAEQVLHCQGQHSKVRAECVKYLREQRDLYESFIEGDFEDYLQRLQDPQSWVGQVEISALAVLYRHDFIIFQVPGEPPVNITENGYPDKVQLCFLNGNHYDSVYPMSYTKSAALCQSILYELLYERVFGVERNVLTPSLKGSRVRDETVDQGQRQSSGESDLDEGEDFWSSEAPVRTASVNNRPPKGRGRGHPRGGRCCLPQKVHESLNTTYFRNVEYDVWLKSKKVQQRRDFCMAAGMHYQAGDKCQVRLGNAGRTYSAHIQDVSSEDGPVTVFIEELGEKHSVPLWSLRTPADHSWSTVTEKNKKHAVASSNGQANERENRSGRKPSRSVSYTAPGSSASGKLQQQHSWPSQASEESQSVGKSSSRRAEQDIGGLCVSSEEKDEHVLLELLQKDEQNFPSLEASLQAAGNEGGKKAERKGRKKAETESMEPSPKPAQKAERGKAGGSADQDQKISPPPKEEPNSPPPATFPSTSAPKATKSLPAKSSQIHPKITSTSSQISPAQSPTAPASSNKPSLASPTAPAPSTRLPLASPTAPAPSTRLPLASPAAPAPSNKPPLASPQPPPGPPTSSPKTTPPLSQPAPKANAGTAPVPPTNPSQTPSAEVSATAPPAVNLTDSVAAVSPVTTTTSTTPVLSHTPPSPASNPVTSPSLPSVASQTLSKAALLIAPAAAPVPCQIPVSSPETPALAPVASKPPPPVSAHTPSSLTDSPTPVQNPFSTVPPVQPSFHPVRPDTYPPYPPPTTSVPASTPPALMPTPHLPLSALAPPYTHPPEPCPYEPCSSPVAVASGASVPNFPPSHPFALAQLSQDPLYPGFLLNDKDECAQSLPPFSFQRDGRDLPNDIRVLRFFYNLGLKAYMYPMFPPYTYLAPLVQTYRMQPNTPPPPLTWQPETPILAFPAHSSSPTSTPPLSHFEMRGVAPPLPPAEAFGHPSMPMPPLPVGPHPNMCTGVFPAPPGGPVLQYSGPPPVAGHPQLPTGAPTRGGLEITLTGSQRSVQSTLMPQPQWASHHLTGIDPGMVPVTTQMQRVGGILNEMGPPTMMTNGSKREEDGALIRLLSPVNNWNKAEFGEIDLTSGRSYYSQANRPGRYSHDDRGRNRRGSRQWRVYTGRGRPDGQSPYPRGSGGGYRGRGYNQHAHS